MRDATYLDVIVCLGLVCLIGIWACAVVLAFQGNSLPYELRYVISCATSGES